MPPRTRAPRSPACICTRRRHTHPCRSNHRGTLAQSSHHPPSPPRTRTADRHSARAPNSCRDRAVQCSRCRRSRERSDMCRCSTRHVAARIPLGMSSASNRHLESQSSTHKWRPRGTHRCPSSLRGTRDGRSRRRHNQAHRSIGRPHTHRAGCTRRDSLPPRTLARGSRGHRGTRRPRSCHVARRSAASTSAEHTRGR